ncbi:MAG: 4'-phosphopantetheinyl transferase superfamily protein [Prolixibacteraceae bacterium]|nr:4'-phosphopantetheinyl transferase superfamily protein [Prolixibacteraceae bacterium]
MALSSIIKTHTGTIGLWEMTEPVNTLYSKFKFTAEEKREFSTLRNERRKREFLAVRLLLESVLKCKTEIKYKSSGKPELPGKNLNISISHSGQIAAVLISESNTGIDVEDINRDISPAARRFLSDRELDYLHKHKNENAMRIIYWSAKEAIFKCLSAENISFRTDIMINPFESDENSGNFTGIVKKEEKIYNFSLSYFFFKNNVVVYCVLE